MVVPSTAVGFRAAVSSLRSLNGKEGVSFHTTLTEDRCVRLLVKKLFWGMSESVREELESLTFVSSDTFMSRSCDPAVATRTPQWTALPHPTSSYRWREGLRCQKCEHSPNSPACECLWSRTWPRNANLQCKRCKRTDTSSVIADTLPSGSPVGAVSSGGCATPREQPYCCGCGVNNKAN